MKNTVNTSIKEKVRAIRDNVDILETLGDIVEGLKSNREWYLAIDDETGVKTPPTCEGDRYSYLRYRAFTMAIEEIEDMISTMF